MRALFTTKLRSTPIRSILIICTAVAAISAATFATVSADPMTPPGSAGITITYFGAVTTAPDEWLLDGTLQAPNMSDVTITLGGAGSGTIQPDAFGYFSVEIVASPNSMVSIDATDSTSTAHAETILEQFNL